MAELKFIVDFFYILGDVEINQSGLLSLRYFRHSARPQVILGMAKSETTILQCFFFSSISAHIIAVLNAVALGEE